MIDIDTYARLHISKDLFQAEIEFLELDDTLQLDENHLLNWLKTQGVVFGILQEEVADICRNLGSFSNQQVLIAQGKSPQSGTDGTIEYTFNDDSKNAPKELQGGKVDFKETARISNVVKGECIAKRILATVGTEGMNIKGETIKAKDGKEARFSIGKNVVPDKEKMSLYAALDGMVSMTDGNRINVFPVYQVNGDVDYEIGNIDFVGNVVIRGNVLPGFKVKATGDIRITGSVEAATIISEGSITISGGILGQNKASITAGTELNSSFIQDAEVKSGDRVVTQSIMHSTVQSGRTVDCTRSKGLIVGGRIQAGEAVIARNIGNSLSMPTVVEVGVPPEIRNELSECKEHLIELSEQSDKTKKALDLLNQMAAQGQLPQDKLMMRVKLNNTFKQHKEEMEKIKERIMEIEKALLELEQSKIDVQNMIFGGVKLVIGRHIKYINEPLSRSRFRLADGDIRMTILD